MALLEIKNVTPEVNAVSTLLMLLTLLLIVAAAKIAPVVLRHDRHNFLGGRPILKDLT